MRLHMLPSLFQIEHFPLLESHNTQETSVVHSFTLPLLNWGCCWIEAALWKQDRYGWSLGVQTNNKLEDCLDISCLGLKYQKKYTIWAVYLKGLSCLFCFKKVNNENYIYSGHNKCHNLGFGRAKHLLSDSTATLGSVPTVDFRFMTVLSRGNLSPYSGNDLKRHWFSSTAQKSVSVIVPSAGGVHEETGSPSLPLRASSGWMR